MSKLETILSTLATMVVLLAPVGCTMYESKLISDLVKAGKDPLEARCAISSGSSNCTALANKAK